MPYLPRIQEQAISRALERNKSVLLLGARQTGKTTTIRRLKSELFISLTRPDDRIRYEKTPATLIAEVEAIAVSQRRPLVVLDEIQKVPALLDVVQDLIDRERANFVLCGSSARKLRQGPHANLLPGRVVVLRLDPFVLLERSSGSLEQHLLYGDLPGIAALERDRDRETDLRSYVTTYLEEEVRAEALVRNLGAFARFLELAAAWSGHIVNLRKLSQEIGVAHTTIASHYQVLEDCLIGERIAPLSESRTRKKLTRSSRWLFFDLGVRRLAADEGTRLPRERLGFLFEQYIGLELLRLARLSDEPIRLRFWRDPDGPEVDWIIDREDRLTPVEVKWTAAPTARDIRHLRLFLAEYPRADSAYVVCQTPRRMKLADRVWAVPWQECDGLVR